MKMLHIPFLSLLVTGLTFVNVQGEAVHIKSALQSSDPSGPKCLAVNSFADGAPVEIYQCDGDNQSPRQSWDIASGGLGEVRMTTHPNYCLDAGNTDTSSKVELWECNGTPQQRWVFRNNRIHLEINSDMCLDVPNSDDIDGNVVQTYQCNGGANQLWMAAIF